MRTHWRTQTCRRYVTAGTLVIVAIASPLAAAEPAQREQIGEVLGKPVFRDEIRTTGNVQLRGELHRLFTLPVLEQFRQAHQAEIEPTEKEIATAAAWFNAEHAERIKDKEPKLRKELQSVEQELAAAGLSEDERRKLEINRRTLQAQLDPPGRFFAEFMLKNWKFHRHLYDHYGGGRILWQQAGLEAFDAMHRWLLDEEKQGKFKITDSKLRSVFYEYWTTMKHGAFLTADKDRIRREFLEPDWTTRQSTEDRAANRQTTP